MDKKKSKVLIIIAIVILFVPIIGYISLETYVARGVMYEGYYISSHTATVEITSFYNNNGCCPNNIDVERFPFFSKFFSHTLKQNTTENICYTEATVADFDSFVRKKKIILFTKLNPNQKITLSDWQCVSDALWIFSPNNCKSLKLPNELFP